ncbi:hypothetical protein HDZ31DRAFT_70188 [Schizophyllum fasciatum]
MFAPVLALLSGVALANAAGLRSASTSQYGQSEGDWIVKQVSPDAYVLGGSVPTPLSVSAVVENGELNIQCPFPGFHAVLVPTADPAKYTVELVKSNEGLPEGTIFGGWVTSDDKTGLKNPSTTTKVTHENLGSFDLEVGTNGGVNTLVWKVQNDEGPSALFVVLDSANDASC